MKNSRNSPTRSGKYIDRRQPGAAGHDEWLIDESIEETFPASDPTSPSQPDSSLASKYRWRKEKKTRHRVSDDQKT